MDKIDRNRAVAPFFSKAINQIFYHPEKSLFAMDGPIGMGKTSEFTVRGPYQISCIIPPIQKGKRLVRESKWAVIRQSEQSAINTIKQILQESIFGPKAIGANPNIITNRGAHPTEVWVMHDLLDGTSLEMCIECHGFNNEQAFERLKTHEFLGTMIPEMQGIPWIIVDTAIERSGRWRADDIIIKKTIDGKTYSLSGQEELTFVFGDINIPSRPHELYDNWYDKKDKSLLPFTFMSPPKPILPIPIDKVRNKKLFEKYPRTIYNDHEVLWVPNPKAYDFTRHYEKKDENENRIPWTGYKYWLNKVYRSESEVTRYILGLPDSKAGKAAVYRRFKSNEITVVKKPVDRDRIVYAGIDPGGHAAIAFMQLLENNHIHIFKEIIFGLEDNVDNRSQIYDFFYPYCVEKLQHLTIIIVPDPAAMWLGKNKMVKGTESFMNTMKSAIMEFHAKGRICKFKIEGPKCTNQDKDIRINSLGYFINQKQLTIDPSCETLIDGLLGGYHFKQNRSKDISDVIDKADPTCDVVEAAQYPLVNILKKINDKRNRTNENKTYKAKQTTFARR